MAILIHAHSSALTSSDTIVSSWLQTDLVECRRLNLEPPTHHPSLSPIHTDHSCHTPTHETHYVFTQLVAQLHSTGKEATNVEKQLFEIVLATIIPFLIPVLQDTLTENHY